MQGKPDLVSALLTASRALVAVSAQSLADVDDSITLVQFRTLVVLSNGERTLADLAAELGVNSSSAQRQVERLLRDGRVDRRENPQDRREVLIGLSEVGAALVSAVTRRRRTAISTIVRKVPVQHRHALIEALDAFAIAAGEPTDSPSLDW